MELEYAEDVEVDVCLDCKGIWLDKGELKDLEGKKKKDFSVIDKDRELDLKYDKYQERMKDQSFFGKLRRLLN